MTKRAPGARRAPQTRSPQTLRCTKTSFIQLPYVSSASVTKVWHEDGRLALSVAEPHRALPALLDYTRQTQRELSSLTTRHATLEDVFVTLTGRHLRDGGQSAS